MLCFVTWWSRPAMRVVERRLERWTCSIVEARWSPSWSEVNRGRRYLQAGPPPGGLALTPPKSSSPISATSQVSHRIALHYHTTYSKHCTKSILNFIRVISGSRHCTRHHSNFYAVLVLHVETNEFLNGMTNRLLFILCEPKTTILVRLSLSCLESSEWISLILSFLNSSTKK